MDRLGSRDQSKGLVLFVDVAGSTQLYEELGDFAAYNVISTCLAQLGDIVARYGGTVIKHIGDEVLCFFDDPIAGTHAAIVAQIETRTSASKRALPIRAACHFGPVLHRSGDIFGDTVNIAAYLGSFAKGGQIMTTELVLELYEDQRKTYQPDYQMHGFLNFNQPLETRLLTTINPKGKQYAVSACLIHWEAFLEEVVADWTYVKPMPVMPATKVFKVLGSEEEFSLEAKSLVVGRVAGVDIQINNRNVSRSHGTFKKDAGQVKYMDQSSNGTYFKYKSGAIGFVHRTQVVLTESCQVSFGVPFEEITHEDELFHCDFQTAN